MMKALTDRGLASEVYLWSDDNLSTDFFWRYLSDDDRSFIEQYPNYGKVVCFKGFDPQSFSFNTCVDSPGFDRQFALMKHLLSLRIDLYAYVTLTTPSLKDARSELTRFVDRLQELSPNLPLRTIPLEIASFTPTRARMNLERITALRNQYTMVDYWRIELENRYPSHVRECDIASISLSR
jgi:hypothetical protein